MANRTNKEKLKKGINYLLISLLPTFLGPSVLYSAFGNRDKPLYIPILIAGIILIALAGYLMYKGIQTVMRALFDD